MQFILVCNFEKKQDNKNIMNTKTYVTAAVIMIMKIMMMTIKKMGNTLQFYH